MRTLKTRRTVRVQADTEKELDEAVSHYRAKGYETVSTRRDPSGAWVAELSAGVRNASA